MDTHDTELLDNSIADSDQPELEASSDWYVIHSYSGYENKVKKNLESRIDTMGMNNRIFSVIVPTEEQVELKGGKRRTTQRRIFPGYLLIQMILDDDSWSVVRNTPGVTGFVGMGNKPTALTQEEVDRIMNRIEADAPTIKVNFMQGDNVQITDGPFANL